MPHYESLPIRFSHILEFLSLLVPLLFITSTVEMSESPDSQSFNTSVWCRQGRVCRDFRESVLSNNEDEHH